MIIKYLFCQINKIKLVYREWIHKFPLFLGLQYAYLDPASKDDNTGDISIDLPTGTSRSQDDDSPTSAVSGGKGLISGIRSGLSAASKKSARSEITLDELSDLYRSEAEEELREQEAAERRERLAVAAAANKRLFEEDTALRDTVTVNGNGIDNSTKIVSSKTPPTFQNSTCTVKTDTSSTSSSIQTKLGLANDDLRLRKPNGNGKKINRLSCKYYNEKFYYTIVCVIYIYNI